MGHKWDGKRVAYGKYMESFMQIEGSDALCNVGSDSCANCDVKVLDGSHKAIASYGPTHRLQSTKLLQR